MPRTPRPDDLYALRVPTDLRLSPDGSRVCFSVKSVAPGKDGYRTALWLAPTDGSEPARQLTLGSKSDTHPRWSPDGRTIAFLSDRGAVLQAGGGGERPGSDEVKEGATQVWLLPTDGGEARPLTRLPRDVDDLCWSPDGQRLCLVSSATRRDRVDEARRPDDPPDGDTRLLDRLQYQLNGVGFIHDRIPNLWVVSIDGTEVRRLTSGAGRDESPVWSPDGRRIAFVSNRHADADLDWRSDVYLVDAAAAEGGRARAVTGGRGRRSFRAPQWSPDGEWLAAIGHRYPAGAGSRNDVWRFRPKEGEEGENLTSASDLMVGSVMNSDLFGGADPRLVWSGDGGSIIFSAPVEGSYELWRVDTGTRQVKRLTEGRHYLSRFDAVRVGGGWMRAAAVEADGDSSPEVVALELPAPSRRGGATSGTRRLSRLMDDAWGEIELARPQGRWHEVDGRRIQGWLLRPGGADGRPTPLVVEIHGGPQTLYGWAPFWEWQCLVAAGMSVYACNPRGSEGYGQDFAAANYRDWGDGPMRDVMTGVDAIIAEGLADPERLGVTGGSYGGYLTSWIVGHTDRFRAAVTCRSVNDMTSQMLSGDIAGPQFGALEYGANPWDDPDLYRAHSPLTFAERIRTPLLIQHAENDLRCTITQAEELFTVLRSLKRPVRLMRVPDETHELTRSGTPFRRVENLDIITGWFRHFLVDGKRGLPPIPRRKDA